MLTFIGSVTVWFSILFASLELGFFRYPKLVVNDKIVDKGMEEARSKNLQRIVVELSKNAMIGTKSSSPLQ